VTGLLNRRGFIEKLEEALGPGRPAALALLDLDHFKRVNDTHGHAAGDAILQRVGEMLIKAAPEGAAVARLGGDEFALLLTGDHACKEQATELANRILEDVLDPLRLQGVEAQIGVSLGVALDEAGVETPTVLMRRSDIAMYEAKRSGRNRTVWFDKSMEDELQRRNKLEADMRIGITAGQFVPFYQPQIDLVTGEIHGFEVLARWRHPTQGLVEPISFIPVAEATGLIGPLSMSVMRQALTETLTWDERLMIAVNLSPIQLKDSLLPQHILKLLSETGFPARRLELEITESALFEDLELALSTIEGLKNQGITISLDDFGTGYSSLTQLQALPFDRIKIDRSFVLSMMDNEESAAIVSAITSLGASLHLPVTAEGVETVAIQNSLKALGCAQGQGWHYGKPLPGAEITKLMDVAERHASSSEATLSKPVSCTEIDQPCPGERRDQDRRGASRKAAA
jgi:diguanylate cyclase (GGDEF)-like protein